MLPTKDCFQSTEKSTQFTSIPSSIYTASFYILSSSGLMVGFRIFFFQSLLIFYFVLSLIRKNTNGYYGTCNKFLFEIGRSKCSNLLLCSLEIKRHVFLFFFLLIFYKMKHYNATLVNQCSLRSLIKTTSIA